MTASGRSKILVRVDGSSKLGMGHVMRCIRLARHLSGRLDPKPQIEFAAAEAEAAKRVIRASGFAIHEPGRSFAPEAYDSEGFPEIIGAYEPHLIILDSNWSENPDLVGGLPEGIPVISLHEYNFPVLEGASAAVNPSLVEQSLPTGGLIGQTHFQGADYLLLEEQIASLPVRSSNDYGTRVKALVCMGGADPGRLTVLIVNALTAMKDVQVEVVIGPAFHEDIQKQLESMYGIKIHNNPPSVVPLLANSDLAIVNAATVMLESVALGVPTIAIPRNAYEAEQAAACVSAGAVIATEGRPTEGDIRPLVDRVITEPRLRERLSQRGRKMIDGKGIIRVGEIITSHLS